MSQDQLPPFWRADDAMIAVPSPRPWRQRGGKLRLVSMFHIIDGAVFGRFRQELVDLLRQELVGTCASVLDIGCGENSPLAAFAKLIPHSVGVDRNGPGIEGSRSAGRHSHYLLAAPDE